LNFFVFFLSLISYSFFKLESMGIKIDRLTPEQEEYLAGWSEGT